MIDHEIGYIKVSRFSQTTYEEFQEALTKLKGTGMKIPASANHDGQCAHSEIRTGFNPALEW